MHIRYAINLTCLMISKHLNDILEFKRSAVLHHQKEDYHGNI